MTKAMEVAKEFNKELLNHPLVIEYKKYSNIVNSNSKYKEVDLKLRTMQKDIVNNYSLELVNEYKKLKEEFTNDPIISNYLTLKEELNTLLNTLQDIINDNL